MNRRNYLYNQFKKNNLSQDTIDLLMWCIDNNLTPMDLERIILSYNLYRNAERIMNPVINKLP